jgi:hypothetical protein
MAKDANAGKAASTTAKKAAPRGVGVPSREAGAKELTVLATKVGNDRVGDLVKDATQRRDALLAHILQRLGALKGAQSAELRAMSDRRVWFDEVARGQTGFALPDAGRWREPALLYRRAAEALCGGDIGRGADLLRRAADAEAAAFASMPGQVDLPTSERQAARAPTEAMSAHDGETCPVTHAPSLFKLADSVIRIADRAPEVAHPRQHRRKAWWQNEEEDDEAKADAGTTSRTGAAAAASDKERASKEAADKAASARPAAERDPAEQVAQESAAPSKQEPTSAAKAASDEEAAARAARKARAADAARDMARAVSDPEKAAADAPQEQLALAAAKANADAASASRAGKKGPRG